MLLRLLLGCVALAGVGLGRRARHVMAVAPELRTLWTWLPLPITNRHLLRIARRIMVAQTDPVDGVEAEPWPVRRRDGTESMCFIYRPNGEPRGALLWIHGGGTVLGMPSQDHAVCSQLARDAGVIVVNAHYRLAPEDPFPIGLEDCYDVLRDLLERAPALRVPTDRIAVGGASAGGGIAACLAQLALDRGEIELVHQLLVYPMLDDRTTFRTHHAGRGHLIWSAHSNTFAWRSYLGRPLVRQHAPDYFAASRRSDLSGLPPAWIGVGELDLFHEENISYASRLIRAGVPCHTHTVPRMPHAADLDAPSAPSSVAFRRGMSDALARAMTEPMTETSEAR